MEFNVFVSTYFLLVFAFPSFFPLNLYFVLVKWKILLILKTCISNLFKWVIIARFMDLSVFRIKSVGLHANKFFPVRKTIVQIFNLLFVPFIIKFLFYYFYLLVFQVYSGSTTVPFASFSMWFTSTGIHPFLRTPTAFIRKPMCTSCYNAMISTIIIERSTVSRQHNDEHIWKCDYISRQVNLYFERYCLFFNFTCLVLPQEKPFFGNWVRAKSHSPLWVIN